MTVCLTEYVIALDEVQTFLSTHSCDCTSDGYRLYGWLLVVSHNKCLVKVNSKT